MRLPLICDRGLADRGGWGTVEVALALRFRARALTDQRDPETLRPDLGCASVRVLPPGDGTVRASRYATRRRPRKPDTATRPNVRIGRTTDPRPVAMQA